MTDPPGPSNVVPIGACKVVLVRIFGIEPQNNSYIGRCCLVLVGCVAGRKQGLARSRQKQRRPASDSDLSDGRVAAAASTWKIKGLYLLGLLPQDYGLLWGMAACYFGPLGLPGTGFDVGLAAGCVLPNVELASQRLIAVCIDACHLQTGSESRKLSELPERYVIYTPPSQHVTRKGAL